MTDTAFIDAARQLRARGFAIVWLRPNEKRPSALGWTQLSQEPSDYTAGCNLGLMTGRLSGDLVCVDLDSPQSLGRADEFLPPTGMIDGRPGKPRSHRWYKVTDVPPDMVSSAAGGIGGPKTKHFTGAGIDFLGTGAQASVPPSVHPSGERRTLEADGEPATVPFGGLWAAVCNLAVACGWNPKTTSQARAYVEKLPPAVSGQGGHDATLRVARIIRNDFAMDGDDGMSLLREYNQRCVPPWSEGEIVHKWDAASQPSAEFPRGCKVQPVEPFDNPHLLSRTFPGTWRFWQGAFWEYTGDRYREVPDTDLRARLNTHIAERFREQFTKETAVHERRKGDDTQAPGKPPRVKPVKRGTVTDCMEALASFNYVDGDVSMPCMLPGGTPRNLIAMRNGLVDLDGLLRGEPLLFPHGPEWFSSVCLPYDFRPEGVPSTFLSTLGRCLEGDAERIALFQEWAGYLLTPSTDLQKFLILTGEGGNGKSVACAVLRGLLGEDNVSSVPLEAFGSQFGLWPTLGKLANIATEIGDLDKTAEGLLKGFVDGSKQTFDRKHKEPLTTCPTARLTFATNNLPRFHDRTEGLWRRLLLLPFRVTIPPGERVNGMDKPEFWTDELPSIFLWAVEGRRRLIERGRFTEPAVCKDAIAEYRLESNPARTFLSEACELATDDYVDAGQLYMDYRTWTATNGYSYPLAAQQFGREVRRMFGVDRYRIGSRAERAYVYRGIRRADRRVPYVPSGVPLKVA